ncbi:hypothetical protein [Tellurirhabdus bombi]|uniref:hypothetical protein n=1 Tax=Tellurirhabdus bombi TaxID=2907205 RepID=UPI001F4714E0|nr:hypothetical protein [Tellurirhabdus bombi]
MKILDKIREVILNVRYLRESNKELRLLIGTGLAKQVDLTKPIRDAEFRVFSQFGEDGIIQYLIQSIGISDQAFVEFGVETYEEANTKFLLMHDNWRGLVIDGSSSNIDHVRKDPNFWKYDLTAVSSFIKMDNINTLLKENGFSGEIGLLSIDIDGNDYWVWKAINVVQPAIVIIEYNSLFGPERAITIPYQADFVRSNAHYSNLYFGASFGAVCDLATEKGYALVACNKAGNNAFFVRKDLLGHLKEVSPQELFTQARFREARNANNELSFASLEQRLAEIKGLPVFNTRTGQLEAF